MCIRDSTSSINAQFGDYLGISADNFFYYGVSNKIGIFANASYNEADVYKRQQDTHQRSL